MPYRVKDDKTGHEYTVAAVVDGQSKVDKPALDVNGRWRAPKYNLALSKPKQAAAAPPSAPPATPATPAADAAPKAKEATA